MSWLQPTELIAEAFVKFEKFVIDPYPKAVSRRFFLVSLLNAVESESACNFTTDRLRLGRTVAR
jgi:hypothetical protein